MQRLALPHQISGVCLQDTTTWLSPRKSQFWEPVYLGQGAWAMSQPGDSAAQSTSYYSCAQFPSPTSTAMAAQYSYPPPEGQSNSPSGSNMPLPPLSLPPIRSIDVIAQPQQQQGQQGAQAPMGTVMAPGPGQYYGQGQAFPPPSDPNAHQRWPLPPDGRVMSGGRHKKEIKRRTKTGCLTCRKRRIKVR